MNESLFLKYYDNSLKCSFFELYIKNNDCVNDES